MKIAVLSDIHGNLAALDAVLADRDRRGVDVTVNLGDILSGPLEPSATADRLMPLALPTVRGNHERQVLTQTREEMNASDRFTVEQLRPEQLAWLDGLPATRPLSDEVLLVHATPHDDLTYFLETVVDESVRIATDAEVASRAGAPSAKLIVCGHTHVPRAVQLADGPLIINPGSVGLQAFDMDYPTPHLIEVGSPHARYAIVERRAGSWHVEHHAVAYDWDAAAKLAARNGRPDWAHALRTGRALRG